MTTEQAGTVIDQRQPANMYRPTPLQYFIGACWGALLVLCVCAEALKTMLA